MPRTFGATFTTQLANTVDKQAPAPKPLWGVYFRFSTPTGDLYFSSGKTFTHGGNTYRGRLIEIGDIASLIDRSEPTRLDVSTVNLSLDNLIDPETSVPNTRFSSYFRRDLESIVTDLILFFDLGGGLYTAETMFRGVVQSSVEFGFRNAHLTILSLIKKYLSVGALRVLSDADFPFIRSGDNGKGVPLVFGTVARAPGRVVKEKPWTDPEPDIANSTSGTLGAIELGALAITEEVTITFTSATLYDVTTNARGSVGSGSVSTDFGSIYTYFLIPAASWSGTQATDNVFTFSIDVSTTSLITFSESPTVTPLKELRQLWWNDYAVTSGYSLQALTQSGALYTRVGQTKEATSGTLDAPIPEVYTIGYGTSGIFAGDYEYVQTFVSSDGESNPSGVGKITFTDSEVPLPAPQNQPTLAYDTNPFAGGSKVDKGTHRWAVTYVSAYGETIVGAVTQEFDVNYQFMDAPSAELVTTYEGAGQLFKTTQESPLSWVYTWVNAEGGETTPSPARSIQVLDLDSAILGMRIGLTVTETPPAGCVYINFYRTEFTGATGDFSQLNESGEYYKIASLPIGGLGELKIIDDTANGSGFNTHSHPPTTNESGSAWRIALTDIPKGPPGTVKRRIYRNAAGDNGPFKLIHEIPNNTDTAWLDNHPDSDLDIYSGSVIPADYRTGPPWLPLDADLSGDETNMVGTIKVTMPPPPDDLDPTPTSQNLYRSKKDVAGTYYLHSNQSYTGADIVIIDSTEDGSLGTQRPPGSGTSSSSAKDSAIAHGMRLYNPQPLLAKSLGLKIGKIGSPTGDVQLQVIADTSGQPTGTTLATVSLLEQEISGGGLLSLVEKKLKPATVIPAGTIWFTVTTPQSDATNYYVIALATTKPANSYYAYESSLHNKWLITGGAGLVFTITGSTFTLDENGTDAAGFPVAMATMDVEIPDDVNVSCDAQGLQDDGSGTYTGTPSALITLPGNVVHWLSVNVGGIDGADIDLAGTFAATNAKYGTRYRINGVVQEIQTLEELIMQLGRETRSLVDWSFDKLEWKYLPSATDVDKNDIYKTIYKGDIELDSDEVSAEPLLSLERLAIEGEVVNSIDMHWKRRAWLESGDLLYARVTHGEDEESVALYNRLTRTDIFDLDFIADEDSVIDLVAFYLSRLSTPNKHRITVTLVPTFLDVEKDDIVAFDASLSLYGEGIYSEGVYGGGTQFEGLVPASLYQVEGKTIKSNLSVEFVLREL